jgi:hypothetical protein
MRKLRTDDLIKAMVADQHRGGNLDDALRVAVAAGGLLAGVAFFSTLGLRPDAAEAAHTVRFLFKFVLTISLAVMALAVVFRIGKPGVPVSTWAWAIVAVPVLLCGAVVIELIVTPRDMWSTRLVGTNSIHCLTIIPLLAMPVLAALLIALRKGAPAKPGLAGAAAGLASAAIAATYYASNCTDDSPLFVATWYPLATAIVVIAGSLASTRYLRW